MKNKFVLVTFTALALVTLSACGGSVTGVAVGAQTTGASSQGPADPTDGPNSPTIEPPTSPEDDPTTTEDDPTTSDDTSTADDPTTSDDTSTGGDDTSGPTDLDGCQAVTEFATSFASMIQKIQSGSITQEDVDAVFNDDVKAGLPESAVSNYERLEKLSNQLVGKEISEIADVANELTEGAQELQDVIKEACGIG